MVGVLPDSRFPHVDGKAMRNSQRTTRTQCNHDPRTQCNHDHLLQHMHSFTGVVSVWLRENNITRWMQGHGSDGLERLTGSEANRCSRTGALGAAARACRMQVERLMAMGGEVLKVLQQRRSGGTREEQRQQGAVALGAPAAALVRRSGARWRMEERRDDDSAMERKQK
ncbi:hypothetical protein TRIUR3_01859 [Triticum urartu]|uniref:Uncharacterized protein n=1 Tax=Triticum urartu TaxID=4572 RepID=M7YL36_TRIUA|nr:hypothetical protein TRIUR3_01859 [Triticum urartu]